MAEENYKNDIHVNTTTKVFIETSFSCNLPLVNCVRLEVKFTHYTFLNLRISVQQVNLKKYGWSGTVQGENKTFTKVRRHHVLCLSPQQSHNTITTLSDEGNSRHQSSCRQAPVTPLVASALTKSDFFADARYDPNVFEILSVHHTSRVSSITSRTHAFSRNHWSRPSRTHSCR